MNNHIRKIAYQENSAADVLKNPHAKNGKKIQNGAIHLAPKQKEIVTTIHYRLHLK